VIKKLLETLTILTRVVELDRVSAAVNKAHMAMLKTMFSPKKVPLRVRLTYLLFSSRPSTEDIVDAKLEVKEVVVLAASQSQIRVVIESSYSFAKTPLIAAHVPDAMARTIHNGCRRTQLIVFSIDPGWVTNCSLCSGSWLSPKAATSFPSLRFLAAMTAHSEPSMSTS